MATTAAPTTSLRPRRQARVAEISRIHLGDEPDIVPEVVA
jgi:hypothetical protein